MRNDLLIPSHDNGAFSAYLAEPEQASAPGLILIQYICGVNQVMRDIADAFARKGHCVAVPDLYWRQEVGIALINNPATPSPTEQKRALELNDGFDDDTGVKDLEAALAALRRHPKCNGRVGALGYCLGGRLAVLMAMHTDVDCAVSYYGVKLEEHLHKPLRTPTLLHLAGSDYLVSAPARASIVSRLETDPLATMVVHGGVNHAFALVGGPNYSTTAAQCANDASDAFLCRHLSPQG